MLYARRAHAGKKWPVAGAVVVPVVVVAGVLPSVDMDAGDLAGEEQ